VQEELELLNRARAFDQEALIEIHDRYYNAIYRYVSFRIGNPQTVEDLTSEVFTRFLGALGERNAPQNTIRGWLYGAASRVVKEHYRREKRAKVTHLDESVPSRSGDPAKQVEESQAQESLRQAMSELTEDQQNVLALRFGYGLPIKEVARTMNKSEGSIKMLQVRAIATLSRNMSGSKVGQ
jgi:RNA polymerase sigma-70 factor (ECF subfamily)